MLALSALYFLNWHLFDTPVNVCRAGIRRSGVHAVLGGTALAVYTHQRLWRRNSNGYRMPPSDHIDHRSTLVRVLGTIEELYITSSLAECSIVLPPQHDACFKLLEQTRSSVYVIHLSSRFS